MIIQFKRGNNMTRKFDLSLISDKMKDEYLIINQSLKIFDIIDYNNLKNSLTEWISCIHLFERIINGYFCVESPDKLNQKITQINLMQLIENHVSEKDENNYKQLLFNYLVKKQLKTPQIIWKNIMELWALHTTYYTDLMRSYLYNLEEMKVGILFDYYKIKYNNIRNIELFTWEIKDDEWNKFKKFNDKMIYSKSKKIFIDDNNRRYISYYFGCRAKYHKQTPTV
eukprot:539282_1